MRKEKSPFSMHNNELRTQNITSKSSIHLLSNRSRKDPDKSLKFSEVTRNQMTGRSRATEGGTSHSDIRVFSRISNKKLTEEEDRDDHYHDHEQRIRRLQSFNTNPPQYVHQIKEEYRNAFKELVGQINSRFLSVDKSLFQLQQETAFANRLISNCNVGYEAIQKQHKLLRIDLDREKKQPSFQIRQDYTIKAELKEIERRNTQQILTLKKQITEIAITIQNIESTEKRSRIVQLSSQQIDKTDMELIGIIDEKVSIIEAKLALLQRKENTLSDRINKLEKQSQPTAAQQILNESFSTHINTSKEQVNSIRGLLEQNQTEKNKLKEDLTALQKKVEKLQEMKSLYTLFQQQSYFIDTENRLMDACGQLVLDCNQNQIRLQSQHLQMLKQHGIIKSH